MQDFLTFVGEYGWAIALVGCFLEGEFTLMLCGYAIFRGPLSVVSVAIPAFFGAVAGDMLAFYLGKRGWGSWLWKIKWLSDRRQRIMETFKRRPLLTVTFIRFQIAMRNLGYTAIAGSGISFSQFTRAVLIANLLWLLVILTFCISLGPVMDWFLGIWMQVF